MGDLIFKKKCCIEVWVYRMDLGSEMSARWFAFVEFRFGRIVYNVRCTKRSRENTQRVSYYCALET